MATYSEKKAKLDTIAQRTVSNIDKVNRAFDLLTQTMNDLESMIAEYENVVQEIDTDATGNPSDQVVQFMKKEKDKIVSDFIAFRTKVINIRDAVGALL